jgi:hypothetical protein
MTKKFVIEFSTGTSAAGLQKSLELVVGYFNDALNTSLPMPRVLGEFKEDEE